MKVKIDVPIVFQIMYSNVAGARACDCKTIERKVDRTITVEVPDEVVGLINNLKWSETLGLWIVIQTKSNVDREVVTSKQQGSERKSIRERLHW
jgi:hypothetical protein